MILFTRPDCLACDRVKEFIASTGYKADVRTLDTEDKRRSVVQELQALVAGTTLPEGVSIETLPKAIVQDDIVPVVLMTSDDIIAFMTFDTN